MSNSLRSHEPQHTRPPCLSPTPRVYPNPCPLSRWCHATISSSVVPFSFCLQSFPASGSFQMSQLFASGGPSISFSFNISASSEHPGLISFRMDWLDVQGTLESLQHNSSKASILQHSAFFILQLSYPYLTTGNINMYVYTHTHTHTHTHTYVSPLFFNCRTIVLQCCAGFWYTPLWTSCNHTNTPSILSLLPSQPSRSSHSTRLGSLCHKELLTSYLFHTWHCIYTRVYTSYIYT